MKQTIYTLSFIVMSLMCSCRAKDGAPGPAGATGATGTPGSTGTTGTSKIQQGTINGTLSYVDVKGKPISFPFDFQYLTSVYNENSYAEYTSDGDLYRVIINRTTLKDSKHNNLSFDFYGDYDETGKPLPPTAIVIKHRFSGQYSDTLFVFETADYNNPNIYIGTSGPSSKGESAFTFSDFSFDIKTGELSFNYIIDLNNNDVLYDFQNPTSDTRASIQGAVNIKMLNVPVEEQPAQEQPAKLPSLQ